MLKMTRLSQKARKKEIHEINQATQYRMKKNEPLRKAAETPIAPPPPAPADESRRMRRSTQRTRFAPQDDCSCCNGSHSDDREEAVSEPAPAFIPLDVPATRLSEQHRQPYASWSEFDEDMRSGGYYGKVYGGGVC